jgi:diguanylate cyclase (GGDEF)-like protein
MAGTRGENTLDLERIRVLIVEDDMHDAELITRVLSRGAEPPCEYAHVQRLSAAIPLAQGSGFDVVLLDLSLPDSLGLASLQELALAAPRMPIVVLTGLEEASLGVQAIRSGAQDYLVKGASDPLQLHRALRYAIERKAVEKRLAERAHFDQLTGLVNRSLFQDRLEHSIARAKRAKACIGLMFVDLDGFKAINDSLGHAVGDEVLLSVADQLRCSVRESESVARLGGDEFTVLLDPVQDAACAAVAAERILKAMQTPLMVSGRNVNVTASIGIALFPDHACDAGSLLQHADAAMFLAKGLGKNRFHIHSPG